MSSNCPYCHSAKSLLLGNVYCSKDAVSMDDLHTGTLFIRSKVLEESDTHVSRLSIRLMRNGRQQYTTGAQQHIIDKDSYLILNQGQTYRTTFAGDIEQEMILVAFQPAFVQEVLYDLITPEDRLLDEPEARHIQPLEFFEKKYRMDATVQMLFLRLRKMLDVDIVDGLVSDTDAIYADLLTHMLGTHRRVSREIDDLGSVKRSTRIELYRRVHLARSYLDAHTDRMISIEEAARAACLSAHHFKRTFKQIFHKTPHQYHIERRLEIACDKLREGVAVSDAGSDTGFGDSSAFIRLFRKHFGCTPGQYSHHGRN